MGLLGLLSDGDDGDQAGSLAGRKQPVWSGLGQTVGRMKATGASAQIRLSDTRAETGVRFANSLVVRRGLLLLAHHFLELRVFHHLLHVHALATHRRKNHVAGLLTSLARAEPFGIDRYG